MLLGTLPGNILHLWLYEPQSSNLLFQPRLLKKDLVTGY